MKFENILEWYSGKALDIIRKDTIPTLERCDEQGYWLKGVSRSVKAQLNKCNVAAKWARDVEKALDVGYDHPLHDALSNMRYGSYGRAARMLTKDELYKRNKKQFFFTKKGTAQSVNETIDRWAWAFAAVNALISMLDERRPKPVVVMKTLSPTVAQNISAAIGIDISTIRSPPMHGEWEEFEWKGKKCRVWVVVIDWPPNTLHNKSRFYHSGNNHQCQACGHAIQNPFNWVPILATVKPYPVSLWVGRDCAMKLFGCEVEGDAIYKR